MPLRRTLGHRHVPMLPGKHRAPGATADAALVAESIRDQLLRLNSEFAHYVPAERQLPEVVLRPSGDPEYFPVGVKHRYTRQV